MPEPDQTPPVFKLPVKVIPGASQNAITGWLGNELKIRVTASPERGKANVAVEKIVAQALGLPKGAAKIISGKTSARKILEITGLPEADIMQHLTGAQEEH
jgi:uncharacterized protein YggU (UPF0235/DUF167 family)